MDPKAIGTFNLGALIAGVVSFILSLFERYVAADAFGETYGTNAWTSYATLGMLLVLAATAVVAVKVFARQVVPPNVPLSLIALALAGLGTFLVILRALTAGEGAAPGWSGYLLFASTIALTVFTALTFRDSGEKLPNYNQGGNNPPSAGPPAH